MTAAYSLRYKMRNTRRIKKRLDAYLICLEGNIDIPTFLQRAI